MINFLILLLGKPCIACRKSGCKLPWCDNCASCVDSVNIGEDNIIILIITAFIVVFLIFNRDK